MTSEENTNTIFTTIINNDNNKLFITELPDDINTIINKYIENMSPFIQDSWNNSFTNKILGSKQDMNAGIYHTKFFNEHNRLYKDEEFIVKTAYNMLKSCGFSVDQTEGIIHTDIFHMDAEEYIDTHYDISSDNHISNEFYHTCVFYIRKDENVIGDLDIYTEPPAYMLPSIFGEGEKMVLPTKTNMVILRNGDLYYQMQPKSGHGVEHILTVCLKVKE